jgi:hypothetical protein
MDLNSTNDVIDFGRLEYQLSKYKLVDSKYVS